MTSAIFLCLASTALVRRLAVNFIFPPYIIVVVLRPPHHRPRLSSSLRRGPSDPADPLHPTNPPRSPTFSPPPPTSRSPPTEPPFSPSSNPSTVTNPFLPFQSPPPTIPFTRLPPRCPPNQPPRRLSGFLDFPILQAGLHPPPRGHSSNVVMCEKIYTPPSCATTSSRQRIRHVRRPISRFMAAILPYIGCKLYK